MSITMNEDTNYVHTHVVNYEPTYLVLMEAVNNYRDGGDLCQSRDMVEDAIESNVAGMGLQPSDLTDDVDCIDMILWELGNE